MAWDIDAALALSQRLSLASAPPDDWRPEQPLILHRPPYPTEDLMRCSRLFQLMNVGIIDGHLSIPAEAERSTKDTTMRSIPSINKDQPAQELLLLDLDLNPDLL